jgi:hypothetical protein
VTRMETEMGFWLLTHTGASYEEFRSLMVRAATEDDARRIAVAFVERRIAEGGYYGDSWGAHKWLDEKRTTCEAVPVDGPAEVVMDDYWNG